MIVVAKALSKSFQTIRGEDTVILEEVNVALYAGRITAVVGRNGIGKTTLLKLLAGIEDPSDGLVLRGATCDERPFVGIAFQEVEEGLLPWRRNLRNLTFGLEALGYDIESAVQNVLDFLARYDLSIPLEAHPRTSSGGQRQMMSVIRAAVLKPHLLLLDEPFSKIDPQQIWTWRSFLMSYVSDINPACLLITHSLDDALFTSDVIHILGKAGASGATIRKSFTIDVPRTERSKWRYGGDYNQLLISIVREFDLSS